MNNITYRGKQFPDRLSLFVYFCKINNNKFKHSIFLHSSIYYCRAALEEKFKRPFSLLEVRELIKDMPKTSTASKPVLEKPLVVIT